jgi:hypothetical protein
VTLLRAPIFALVANIPCQLFYSAVPRVLQLWKGSLVAAKREKTAQALADPLEYEDMFPDLQYSLLAEQAVKAARETPVPASSYFAWKESLDRDIISGTSPQVFTFDTSRSH